jgi:YD repeat-containing protein
MLTVETTRDIHLRRRRDERNRAPAHGNVPGGRQSFSDDAQGHIASRTYIVDGHPDPYVLRFERDALGRLVRLVQPDGTIVAYDQYDNGLVRAVPGVIKHDQSHRVDRPNRTGEEPVDPVTQPGMGQTGPARTEPTRLGPTAPVTPADHPTPSQSSRPPAVPVTPTLIGVDLMLMGFGVELAAILVICRPCHEDIHAGRAPRPPVDDHWRAV